MAIVVTIACSGPLELANIQVGRSLNQDRSVASITTLVQAERNGLRRRADDGAGKGMIGEMEVRHAGDRRADQAGDYDGPTSTEFHLQNSGGFPPGDYSVDVFIDGVQVGTRAFKVDRIRL